MSSSCDEGERGRILSDRWMPSRSPMAGRRAYDEPVLASGSRANEGGSLIATGSGHTMSPRSREGAPMPENEKKADSEIPTGEAAEPEKLKDESLEQVAGGMGASVPRA